MGSCQFFTKKIGQYRNARDAFLEAREEAQYEFGHGGYTGTIAEKNDFKMVPVPTTKTDPTKFAQECFDNSNGFWDDKWAPAGCVEVTGSWLTKMRGERYKGVRNFKVFYFFGWASE